MSCDSLRFKYELLAFAATFLVFEWQRTSFSKLDSEGFDLFHCWVYDISFVFQTLLVNM